MNWKNLSLNPPDFDCMMVIKTPRGSYRIVDYEASTKTIPGLSDTRQEVASFKADYYYIILDEIKK